jgi:CheY-like chemotaxis protein
MSLDLLDLTKTEGGQMLVKDEPFSLMQTIKDATDPFTGDAKRKNIRYDVQINPSIPQRVSGDQRRVRQILSNLVANAVQHTKEGKVTVEAYPCQTTQAQSRKVDVEIVVEDTGVGMSQSKVDALFRELEEVSYEEDATETNLIVNDPFTDMPSSPTNPAIGLGLAVVARTIRNMNGQLRVKTEEGKGSRFVIVLTFDLDSAEAQKPLAITEKDPRPPTSSSQQDGEVTLVYRAPQKSSEAPVMLRRQSAESLNSFKSGKSGRSMHSDMSQRSDADKLIDAISSPLHFGDHHAVTSPGGSLQAPRRSSLESGAVVPKSRSFPSPREMRSSLRMPGSQNVVDSGTPLRPVRVPEDDMDHPSGSKIGPRVLFEEPVSVGPASVDTRSDTTEVSRTHNTDSFSVLVAEDDPINSKIIEKRLHKLGHDVVCTTNGEECATAYGDQPHVFDVILMDLQMPIVDGFSSTKMIRSHEKSHGESCLSSRAKILGRVPIFAVSASLVEKEYDKYVSTGFDGWILKPLNIKRVEILLRGIIDEEVRNECLYEPGKWEQGGWFRAEKPTAFDVDTHPSGGPTTNADRQTDPESAASTSSPDETPTPSEATVVPESVEQLRMNRPEAD